MKKRYLQLIFLLFLIVGTVLIIRQQQNTPYQKDNGFVFGTVYNITYQNDKNLKQEIETELKKAARLSRGLRRAISDEEAKALAQEMLAAAVKAETE